ncbi:MAG: SpoIIE family protein phosphatase [Actinomycetota bacterium]|nr:SpoIIE family protein phosphatase [Actinomycetota bacterium]
MEGDHGDLGGLDRSRALAAIAERDRLERVLSLLASGAPSSDLDGLARTVAGATAAITGGRVALVVLPERLARPAVGGPDAEWLGEIDAARLAVLAPALDGQLVHVADTAYLDPAAAAHQRLVTLDGRDLRCLLALPIGEEEPIGAVLIGHHRARAFSPRQIALATALVRHLAQMLVMGDAVAEQTRIATALQQTLLPPMLPAVAGVDLAARYRPSGSGNLVGGDFYDVFFDPAGGWYVLLGDSSGIGPEAAGLAGIARYTARALADQAPRPAEMLDQMNLALLRAASEGRFCTAVLAHCWLERDRPARLHVELGSAGHPPAFVLRAGGEAVPATSETGTILGIMADAPVGEASLELEAGDALVFYTDGILEARDARGEPFGEERALATLAGAVGRSAEGVARRLERAVLDHRAPQDRDDMAIVVVRLRAEAH